MNILRRLPYSDKATTIRVGDNTIPVRPYQVVVWVSLTIEPSFSITDPRLPAILDIGHNHNFSIQSNQLRDRAGVDLGRCRRTGIILINRLEVPLYNIHLWIHRNRPGASDLLSQPVTLPVPEGISIYPADSPAPRLPLLGLRPLSRN